MMQKNKIFFIAKSSLYKKLPIMLQGNASYFDMPSYYTTNDGRVKSVVIKHQAMKTRGCNVDGIGRQHKTTAKCDTELKNHA
jgi:hypothetical protein